MDPAELLYAETHEWVHLAQENGDTIATVGISAFAVEALTDLVYIQMPDMGQSVATGDSFGEVESVKAVSDLYSPLAGEIVAVNSDLSDDLAALSQDPYGRGWIVKVKVTNDSDLGSLLDYNAYQKQCDEEA